MQEQAYEIAARIETDHWWFSGRREILAALLDRYLPPSTVPRRILEVGCGNGGNLALLAAYGSVFAVEKDDGARERAALRRIGTVERGWLPDALPFAGDSFDVIAALDVLEHLEDDAAAVRALRDRLSERGMLIVTVPAFQWLWSEHDVLSQHVRRYTRQRFAMLLRHAGLNVLYCGYFNSLLFPFAVANIALGRLAPRDTRRGLQIPPRGINRALRWIFTIESRLVTRIQLPVGLSIVACATRT
jgi:SAM-dependent methyltransferase